MTGGGGSAGGQAGGGSSTATKPLGPLQIEFGDNISEVHQQNAKYLMSKMPEKHLTLLNNRGVRIFVDDRADQTAGWAEYADEEGIDSSSKTADGRALGDLSFYHKGRVFVSDATPHGSVNGYTHELSHALDYLWLGGESQFVEHPPGSGEGRLVRILSDDPEFVDMHTNKIFPNTKVRKYYRTGSTGARTSGRRETFAEGYSSYLHGGRDEVRKLLGSYAVADTFIRILKRHGVID